MDYLKGLKLIEVFRFACWDWLKPAPQQLLGALRRF